MSQHMIYEPLILSILHEILQNEVAVMRGNYPLFSGIRTENAVYYVTPFPQFVSINNSKRALDFAVLSYAIINGMRRYLCGYNIEKPYLWNKDEACNCIEKIIEKTETIIGKKINSLTELISELVLLLIDQGLIKPIPETAVDPDTLKTMKYIKRILNSYSNNSDIVIIENDVELISFSVAKSLMDFFSIRCPKYGYEWSIKDIINAERIVLEKLKLNNIGAEIYYKTLYGELLRSVGNAASLPGHLANFEARILPFIVEPPPPTVNLDEIGIDIIRLKQPLHDFFKRIGINEEERIIMVIDAIIEGLKKAGYTKLNPYQYSYLNKLLNSGPGGVLSILSSPTGSGKTLIFTIYLIALILASKLKGKKYLAMLIYPRKTLARDQLARLINLFYYVNEFLRKTKLNITLSVAIRDGDSMEESILGALRPLRDISLNINGNRFYICHGLTTNKKYVVSICDHECSECIETLDWVYDVKEKIRVDNESITVYELKDVDVVVTNSAMFTKMSIDLYKSDISISSINNIRNEWIKRLRLLILDEAHVYLDPEEMERLFFALMRSLMFIKTDDGKPLSRVSELARNNMIDVIISSATITESKLFRTISGNKLSELDSATILGISRFPLCTDSNNNIPREILHFAERLLGSPLFRELRHKLIYNDYYITIICSNRKTTSIDKIKGPIKLNIFASTFPVPSKNSWTSLAETMISVIHWIHELRRRGFNKALALIFIDNKDTQRQIARLFSKRQILEALDHVDRILLSPIDKYAYNYWDNRLRHGYEFITQELIERSKRGNISLYNAIWDIGNIGTYNLAHFHNLGIYQDIRMIEELVSNTLPNNINQLSSLLSNLSTFIPLIDFSDKVIEYSQIFLNRRGQSNPYEVIEEADRRNIPLIYVIHNADLSKTIRTKIEDKLKDGKPYIVLSTSTLEVGIDIPSVSLVIQYGATTGTAELMQRIGRSGRSRDSMFVSMGLLILRNSGADVHYINQENLIDYVFNLSLPSLPDYLNDEQAISRNILSVLRYVNIDIHSLKEYLNRILDFLEVRNQIKDKVEETFDKIQWFIINYDREISNMLMFNIQGNILKTYMDEIKESINNIYLLLFDESFGISQLIEHHDMLLTEYRYMLEKTIRNDKLLYSASWDIILLRESLKIYDIIKKIYQEQLLANRDIVLKYLNRLMEDIMKLNEYLFKMLIFRQVNEIGKVLRNNIKTYREVVESIYGRLMIPGMINDLGYLSELYIELRFLSNLNNLNISKVDDFNNFSRRTSPLKHRE